jgi:glycosyltransferase involved in cell wall biosynthesis
VRYKFISNFYQVNKSHIYLLAKTLVFYKPDVIVGTLLETSNALIFLTSYLLPQAFKDTKWVAIEQNNTFLRFRDYYADPEEYDFWASFTNPVFNATDKIITCSYGVAQGLMKYFNVKQRISVIHNPIDFKRIAVGKPFKTHKQYILAAGRLHNQKGFDLLINAFGIIKDSISSDLYIVGEGKLRKKLEQQIEEKNLIDRVHLLGFRDDIHALMKSANCFVLSSRYEGFGNVIVEAMACECPVISFDCEYGPSEIIRHNVDGLLVPTKNIAELANSIAVMLSDSALRERLSRAGKRRALDFDIEKIAAEYYRELLV